MSVTYDTLPGTGEQQNYISTATDTQMYPDSNNISVFGPLWLPRVYGKDLTSFEIASSGKIAITINDIHALDISKTGNTTSLSAKSNDSFAIAVNSNTMSLTFDAATDDITMLATKGDVNIVASNDTSITSSNNINVTALKDFILSASNDATFTVIQGNLKLSADSNNKIIDLNSNNLLVTSKEGSIGMIADSNVFTTASNNVTVTACNDFMLTVKSNVSMTTVGTGVFEINGNNSNMYLKFDGVDNTTFLYSSNNFTVRTLNDIYLKAHDSNTTLTLGDSNATLYAISNVTVLASNDLTFQAKEDVSITAFNSTIGLYANQSRTSIVLNTNNDIAMYSSNNLLVSTSNSFLVTALSNVTMIADNGDLSLSAESNVLVYADNSNMALTMNRSDDALSLYSLSNVFVTACNSIAIDSRSNVSITASSNIEMFSRSNLVINTSNSTLITACNQIVMESMSNIKMATSNTTINSSNNFNLTACNDATITAKNNLTLAASNMSFSLTGDLKYTADSNIGFYITRSTQSSNNPILLVSPDRVSVIGDLFITGSINTSNIINTTVVQETLKINDKVILLASEGDEGGNPIDGLLTNSGAGIIVDGVPTTNADKDLWRKSIQWNYGFNGMPDVATSNITTEAAWEFQGGGLRITHKRITTDGMKDLSFTLRINDKDELELVKKYWVVGSTDYTWKRVAKFGKIVGSGIF